MEDIYCFAGNPLDRASERRRDSVWVASLLDDPAARVLPLSELRPLIRGSDTIELDWQPLSLWRETIANRATLVFLGLAERRPFFAIDAALALYLKYQMPSRRKRPSPLRGIAVPAMRLRRCSLR